MTAEILLEQSGTDFCQDLLLPAYPKLNSLTLMNLNGQLTDLAANAASLVFSGSGEWQNLIHHGRASR
ncbi:hypothetical protein PQQ64_25045, partial [Paraburkholderia graminis]|uniref:hypothetical protein n=1 Tax=Paraburkholderia graminis TaxID=60548 RepID=UPI0038B8D24B